MQQTCRDKRRAAAWPVRPQLACGWLLQCPGAQLRCMRNRMTCNAASGCEARGRASRALREPSRTGACSSISSGWSVAPLLSRKDKICQGLGASILGGSLSGIPDGRLVRCMKCCQPNGPGCADHFYQFWSIFMLLSLQDHRKGGHKAGMAPASDRISLCKASCRASASVYRLNCKFDKNMLEHFVFINIIKFVAPSSPTNAHEKSFFPYLLIAPGRA